MNSALLAASAALFLALLAVPLAYLTARRPNQLTGLLDTIAELSFALPGMMLAVTFIMRPLPQLPFLGVSLCGAHAFILLA